MPISVHDTPVAPAAVTGLADRLRGRVIEPGDAEYEASRKVWNGMIDRRPALVVRCAGAADVVHAVRFAAEHDLLVSVRSGGHSFPGHSTNDGGMVIDVSSQRGLRVDPIARRAYAEPGLLQADLDNEAHHFGLAVPGGQVSHTGIAGLTLGGGIGWLSRLRGLACDNVRAADVVLAGGELRRAGPEDDDDLYWAMRGGGGNFGVVTSFEYELHPQGTCLAGVVGYDAAEAGVVADHLAELRDDAPDELGLGFGVLAGPSARPTIALPFVHARAGEDAEKVAASLAEMGPRPVMNDHGPLEYPQVQRLTDAGVAPGRRYYARSSMVPQLSEELLTALTEAYATSPSPHALIGGLMLGGAIARTPRDATAFPHRAHGYLLTLLGVWEDPAEDTANIDWVRSTYDTVQHFVTGDVYVNELVDEGDDRVRAAYGLDHYDRLAALKAKFDPDNLFRMNQNIVPAH